MTDNNLTQFIEYAWHVQLGQFIFVGLVLVVGAFMQWMAYKLFAMGIFGKGKDGGGEVQTVFHDWKITFKRAAPGTFLLFAALP